MQKPSKISFEQLKNDMRVFLNFPEIEKSLLREISEIADRILMRENESKGNSPEGILANYFMNGDNVEERLKAVIGLTGGSLERTKRIFEVNFPSFTWSQLLKDKSMLQTIATILINPKSAKIFIPPFICSNIALPENWIAIMTNKDYLLRIAGNNLQSKYSVHIGFGLEEKIKTIITAAGFESNKGKVKIVGSKEVDAAVPNAQSPRVLIMSSYQLTTASSQTTKANEQLAMYKKLKDANIDNEHQGEDPIYFVNVIDGGGWLSRNKDLKKMWRGCDYCFSLDSLDGLKQVLNYTFNNKP